MAQPRQEQLTDASCAFPVKIGRHMLQFFTREYASMRLSEIGMCCSGPVGV